MKGDACGKTERHEAGGEAPFGAEPLRDEIGRAQHQGALAKKTKRAEEEAEHDQTLDLAKGDGGEAEKGGCEQND